MLFCMSRTGKTFKLSVHYALNMAFKLLVSGRYCTKKKGVTMTLDKLLTPELYAQVQQAIDTANAQVTDKTKQIRFVDLSEGGYVAKGKHDDKVNALSAQVTDLQSQIEQRNTDMADLQTKLTAAAADTGKLTEAQKALTDLQAKYDSDKAEWEKRTAEQTYDFMLREKSNGLKFSSPAAKRDFLAQAKGKNFKIEGENMYGYDEFLSQYDTDNPGAFIKDDPAPAADDSGEKPPQIVLPQGTQNPAADKNAFNFHFNGVRPMPEE